MCGSVFFRNCFSNIFFLNKSNVRTASEIVSTTVSNKDSDTKLVKSFLKFKILAHNLSTLIKTQMMVYFKFWQSGKGESINRFLYTRSLVVSDLHSKTKSSGSSSAMCRGGPTAVIARLICMCLWSGWKWQRGVKVITSPFPCCPVNCECWWKTTQIEKQAFFVGGLSVKIAANYGDCSYQL